MPKVQETAKGLTLAAASVSELCAELERREAELTTSFVELHKRRLMRIEEGRNNLLEVVPPHVEPCSSRCSDERADNWQRCPRCFVISVADGPNDGIETDENGLLENKYYRLNIEVVFDRPPKIIPSSG